MSHFNVRLSFKAVAFSLVGLMGVVACGGDKKPADPTPTLTPDGTRRADANAVPNWFTKSPELEGVEGTRADRAYQELGLGTRAEPIVVAVIDGGVDPTHEDLQGRIWVNAGEVAGNRLDDDRNGYVDDVHGWNFLGSTGKGGAILNIEDATLEVTRESARLKKLKAEREARGESLSEAEAALLAETSAEVESERLQATEALAKNEPIAQRFEKDYAILKDVLKVELADVTLESLKAAEISDAALDRVRNELVTYAEGVEFTEMWRVLSRLDRARETLESLYNEAFDPRAEILGDDPSNFEHRTYGNSDVAGPDPSHGTHVAGIIAAVRGNGLGIEGVAQDVRIMALRAVPNGDEYDKDIANAVRYAVDHGARVINMSFGKPYSPHKAKVDEAFAYAAKRGVLIVHAAGNSALNTDIKPSFPNAKLAGAVDNSQVESRIDGWIDVGASADRLDLDLPAEFTNYGTKTVEIFAPGVEIHSTVNYENGELGRYDSYSGTSMAAPVVAGVAALVLSQRPELNPVQLRQILLDTARRHREHIVRLPFEIEPPVPTLTYFGALSQTGGIVDAYEAIKAALSAAL